MRVLVEKIRVPEGTEENGKGEGSRERERAKGANTYKYKGWKRQRECERGECIVDSMRNERCCVVENPF